MTTRDTDAAAGTRPGERDGAAGAAAGGGGWRRRKKELTRRALIEAGLRLFRERGYQETTIAQVCAEAGIAPRTFFSYFSGKEELVFADTAERLDLALRVIEGRGPHDTVADVCRRIAEETFALAPGGFDLLGLTGDRMELVLSTPALQAAAMRAVGQAEARMARALARAFPGELDAVSAGAAVGALVGAVMGAARMEFAAGRTDARAGRAAMRRAVDIAVRGLERAEPAAGHGG
ncbi:TetR/AcrR family transcriptional regulator [Streptomonospora nanhaiensis]|uniref:TetR/AcrR family transcriptional regulator n=1 Tax=Streptomonospora nanhaiensis TaxID=1323731 RepID=UPI001C37F851|nr:TetR/AcrR family transcriptional regulator [Streptomonospora nanhaiensis]MBV2363435.1 TetR/AcrR family transcriptional regulator [Streptomonospora nanhaiensis]MBX9387669.1 TetR/AcrR family transcriptional regulator [Streptomonospora nanhaiensis]